MEEERVGSLEGIGLEESYWWLDDGWGRGECGLQEQRKRAEAKQSNEIRFMAFPSYIFYLRDSFIQKTNTSLFFAILCKENA